MEIKCPLCREYMEENKEFDFWRCPECGGEWWPDDGGYQEAKERIQSEKDRERLRSSVGGAYTVVNPLISDGLKGVGAKSSSRSGRKRKKKPVKRKLPWMLD